jgi:hypothetical protein
MGSIRYEMTLSREERDRLQSNRRSCRVSLQISPPRNAYSHLFLFEEALLSPVSRFGTPLAVKQWRIGKWGFELGT